MKRFLCFVGFHDFAPDNDGKQYGASMCYGTQERGTCIHPGCNAHTYYGPDPVPEVR